MTSPSCGARNSDPAYQAEALQGVSRTFAVTIPELPDTLHDVVSNAYLLCRITETSEDEPALCTALKQQFWRGFVDLVAGRDDAADFAWKLGAPLSSSTTVSEYDLVANTPWVLRITEGFRAVQRRAIERCVRIMSCGMAAAPGHCSQSGFDLSSLCPGQNDPAFARGLAEVVAISRQHLQYALRFIEIVPTCETGIRRHCLWALGLAVLTLRRIHAKPMFRRGRDVKVSRRSVSPITAIASILARSNVARRLLFGTLFRGSASSSDEGSFRTDPGGGESE